MICVDDIKRYLRINFNNDDLDLQLMLDVSYQYLIAAVDDFEAKYNGTGDYAEQFDSDGFVRTADMLALVIASEFYENRELMNSAESVKPNFLVRSLILQLQTYKAVK